MSSPTRALYGAVVSHDTAAIDAALSSGADINGVGEDLTFTALQAGVSFASPAIVEHLLVRGADVDAPGIHGRPPVWLSVGPRPPIDTLRLLLGAGASTGWRDDQRRTLLHEAVSQRRCDTVALLLAQGLDPDARDEHRHTAVHEAVMHPGEFEVLIALARHGADLDALDDRGRRPIDFLPSKASNIGSRLYTARTLAAAGACLVGRPRVGHRRECRELRQWPLLSAVRTGHLPLVAFALERRGNIGADQVAQALRLACRMEHQEMDALLRSWLAHRQACLALERAVAT